LAFGGTAYSTKPLTFALMERSKLVACAFKQKMFHGQNSKIEPEVHAQQ